MASELQTITTVSEIAKRYQLTTLEPQIEACRALVSSGELIDIGVFGRFKAGKSSFLNSLVGKNILPVGVTPVTAVITRLRYGPVERVTVLYLDQSSKTVSLQELTAFVSETENSNNEKKVASVEVELPELKPFEGLQFVDTPGLGSVFKHNTAAALDWLPHVGVALVAVAVDPPLSENDVALIRELKLYTPRIALLLTKADLVSPTDRMEIENFIDREIKRELGSALDLYPYSIQLIHSKLKEEFEAKLLRGLRSNRDATQAEILAHKIKSLSRQTNDYLTIGLKAAEQIDSDRDILKKRVLDEKTSLHSMREEIQLLVRDALGQTRPRLVDILGEFRPRVEDTLSGELRSKMLEWRGNLWKFNRAYDDWVREAFHREISSLSVQQKAQFFKIIEAAQERLLRAVRAFQGRLSENVHEAMGIQMSRVEFAFEVKEPRSPDISIGSAFDFKLDLLWMFVPMTLFRSRIRNHFSGLILYEVEKNFSRLASQWTEKINAAIQELGSQVERYVKAELESMENLLSRPQSQVDEIKTALQRLESL